jgi:hypothetical protein
MNSKHLKKIIDKQFKIAGLNIKYEDVCDNQIPEWYRKFTCTKEQNEKWKNWTQKYMKEKLKLTKDKAYIETSWFNLNYGLKIKDKKNENFKK